MASRDEHCAVDVRHLGEAFLNVHIWLDAFFKTEGATHRKHRHHWEGIEAARILFGDQGAMAARLHIMLDMGHVPKQSEWASSFIHLADTWYRIDEMGRLLTYLEKHKTANLERPSIAYCGIVACSGCGGENREQRLIDVEGKFLCPECGAENMIRDWRIEL
jgi:predicted RNA-binding Zn-ribbon protein involved in translation (DUF1610 family)